MENAADETKHETRLLGMDQRMLGVPARRYLKDIEDQSMALLDGEKLM